MKKLICRIFGHLGLCEVKRFDELQYCIVYSCKRCDFEKTLPYSELYGEEFEQFKKAFRDERLGINSLKEAEGERNANHST